MLSITGTEVVIWDIMRLGDFEKYVFLLEISCVFWPDFFLQKIKSVNVQSNVTQELQFI